MSNSRFVEDSLEAVLVSIADGVREAQEALNEAPPLDAYGRPLPSYQLPYLDFEIKAEVNSDNSRGGALRLLISKRRGEGGHLSSTLSGRLMAVPAGDGLPLPIVTFSSMRLSARKHRLLISAANSAGEVLIDQGIELNLDVEASRSLSATRGVNLSDSQLTINRVGSSRGTRLRDMVVVTDVDGNAETELSIASNVPAQAILVFTAQMGQVDVKLAVNAGAD